MHAMIGKTILLLGPAVLLAACASESQRTVETPTVAAAGTPWTGPKAPLVVGKFENNSPYLRGMFSDGVDRLGDQAKTILQTHLAQTGRFAVMDRSNMPELKREAELTKTEQALEGAHFVITGQVTEFGRRATGDQQLFGILGRGQEQVARAVVALNVVDVRTSQVVYTTQGAGEYALSNREVVGFGGTAGYDSTLNGKVLDLAIREAVNRLVEGIEKGTWQPAGP